MSFRNRMSRNWPIAVLCAIVAASAAQSVWWVFLVPIYQSPDEPAHLDFALGIHANKGLLLARNTDFLRLPPDSHPYTEYLRDRTHHSEIAFRAHMKMPPDYGTKEYFQAIDRDAPPVATIATCQLAALYPFGYYTLLALWIELVHWWNDGVVATFFGARLFSVLLLVISLVLSYATTRLLNYKPAFALFITACIGMFPLTSFVSSYVQPDNLSFTLVSLCFYLALQARAKLFATNWLVFLGMALGALLVTKIHFWICLTPAIFAMIVAEKASRSSERRRWGRAGVSLLLPSILLGSFYLYTVWGTTQYFAPPHHGHRLLTIVRLCRVAVNDFFSGTTHVSFWGIFGWLDTPIKFRNTRATELIGLLVQIATWTLLALTLFRMEQIASRLILVARAGRSKTALRIAFSNPVINSYFAFTAFMFCLFVWTSNRFGAQGRNWFPMILPIFLVGLTYAPKALTLRRARMLVSASLATGLLLYGVIGNHYARASLTERFYFPFAGTPVIMSLPLEPTERNNMTWTVATGESTGDDPYVIYALERPTFVHGIRLRFTVSNPGNESAKFQAYWKNGDESYSERDRCVRYQVETRRERTVVIWINTEITHLRIDPDDKPGTVEIHEITLYKPTDEALQPVRGSKRSRGAP